ncbi:DsrE family protein [Thiobacillus sedimenti]|uniref:DsrE family protein n=1 Tax=Thiobacillus sedimenti TaxID=3110231 RepID=A0ABZ1CJK0_9PROT|nr:DsrE family protein [Thiobacillus sp. SCUT-2]WRS38472.1 DsrE family protein [Thiobacillus sp. SCUT-2]
MNVIRIACAALCLFGLAGAASAQELEPSLSTRTLVTVDPHAHYKVVYDIHSADVAAGISKGLFYARGLIEAYRKQGVAPKQLDIHLVMHGEAAQYLLIDSTYRDVVDDPFAVNLNAKIVQDLLGLGVSVEICHSVMKSKGWTADDVLPGVTIVHDGYTRLVKLQNDGYAYIGGF